MFFRILAILTFEERQLDLPVGGRTRLNSD